MKGYVVDLKSGGTLMTSEYQIVEKDGRIFVVLAPACQIEKGKILDLLSEFGIDVSAVTFLSPDEVENCSDFEDAPVIFPLDQWTCDLPELDAAGRYCGQVGGRVIVLFDDGFPYAGLHPIAEKYGTQCGWSVDELAPRILNSEADDPSSGSGTPVARPKAGQVKC